MNGEKLFNALISAFNTDPSIDEYGFLLVDKAADSPLQSSIPKEEFPYLLDDHKLGIPHMHIPVLYSYVHGEFMKLINVIRHYERELDEGEDSVLVDQRDVDSLARISDLSKAMVMINAECYTAWNSRKSLVRVKVLNPVQELKFISLVFTKHPKTVDGWLHRQWVLDYILGGKISAGVKQELLEGELRECELLATRYAKNYYAWTHRQFVLFNYCSDVSILLRDLYVNMEHWISAHVSDNCGFHHKEFLILRILNKHYLGDTIAYLRQRGLVIKEDFHSRRPSDFGSGPHGAFSGPKKDAFVKGRKFMIEWFEIEKGLSWIYEYSLQVGGEELADCLMDHLVLLFYDLLESSETLPNPCFAKSSCVAECAEDDFTSVARDFHELNIVGSRYKVGEEFDLRERLLSCSGIQMLLREYKSCNELLQLYPEYETLWCYRRFLVVVMTESFVCTALAYISNFLENELEEGLSAKSGTLERIERLVASVGGKRSVSEAKTILVPFLDFEAAQVNCQLERYRELSEGASMEEVNDLSKEEIFKREKSFKNAISFFLWVYSQVGKV